MSKYLLVVDLPGDGECDGCDLLDHAKARCKVTRTTVGTYFDGNEWHTICPTDCPLVPVERVMERIRSMQGERKASGLDHWNDALDDALDILRDELGVTE